MKRKRKVISGVGCLSSVLGPLLALLLYPRAKWLFAFILIGFAVLWLNHRSAEDPKPQDLADQIENLLAGNFSGWEVDDFEHQSIKDPRLKALHRKSFSIGGLPEEWIKLSVEEKIQMRGLIQELRSFEEKPKSQNS